MIVGTSFLTATAASFCLASTYVLSLYIWNTKEDRDHPKTIRRRFVSGLSMLIISPVYVFFFGSQSLLSSETILSVIGIRWNGILIAATVPVFLTVCLFLGPIFVGMLTDEERFQSYFTAYYWKYSLSNLIWWRNLIVAPLTEEFTFRACMLPILLEYYSPMQAVLISPLFFGVAHLHHLIERIRQGHGFMQALMVSLFQMTYTTIFGMYSSYLFLRTGHAISPILVHSFCNLMGFPDVSEVLNAEPSRKKAFITSYFAGLIAFFLLLRPLTEPDLYSNVLYNV